MATGFCLPIHRLSTVSLLLPLFLAGAVRANLLNGADVTITPTDPGGTGPFTLANSGAGVQTASGSATGGLSSSGNASALTGNGYIQMSGQANGSIDAAAHGIYRDTFILNAPGVAAGTNGQLTFFVSVDGAMDATSGISEARWILNARVGAGALQNVASGNVGSPNNTNDNDPFDPFSTYSENVSFQFGMPTTLQVELIGSAAARYDSPPTDPIQPGAAIFSLFEQAWQGIDLVRVVGGEFIDHDTLTLTSDTGTNWLNPVTPPEPVPEPAALLAVSAVALLLVQRRRPMQHR